MGYSPKNPKFIRECPLKFSTPENGVECSTEKCAFWCIIQKACALLVIAQYFGFSNELRKQKLAKENT